ncbi:MAG: alpha/beta hydrolase [bacterium]
MLITLLIVIFIWAAAVWFFQRSVLFPRGLANQGAADRPDPPPAAEVWHLGIEEGDVEAWLLPGDGASAEDPGPAVVFTHGNGEVIDHWADDLSPYQRMGVTVLLPEYRGYGRSGGTPSQQGITRDLETFVDQLAARDEVDPDRVFYHGRSVGGGFAAVLSRRREPAALILQSTFTSAAAMARRYLVPRFLMRDPLDVVDVVDEYPGPLLVLHGERDSIIPAEHGRRIHQAAPRSTLHLYPMGHNTPPPWRQYWDDIRRFLDENDIVDGKNVPASFR